MIGAAEARAIERATAASVAPIRLVEDDGWVLAASDGYVGRANSVAPLKPGDTPLSAKIDRALAFYAEHRLPPAFRVSKYAEPPELAPRSTTGIFARRNPPR